MLKFKNYIMTKDEKIGAIGLIMCLIHTIIFSSILLSGCCGCGCADKDIKTYEVVIEYCNGNQDKLVVRSCNQPNTDLIDTYKQAVPVFKWYDSDGNLHRTLNVCKIISSREIN